MKILVTGGVRSGKSRHAESLLAPSDPVTYIAPGPVVDDADWTARVAAHQARRPKSWSTVETHDLVTALNRSGPFLIDCLGTWLTALMDASQFWDAEDASGRVDSAIEQLVTALTAVDTVVLVTNEVGMGVVPSHRSGRLFRDVLGAVNQRVGEVCDEVHLVVAGRVLVL